MLHRFTELGLICITQPHHAWLAGQLALHWGNKQFGTLTPRVEVCLGAEIHDIGWLGWERSPTLNRETGYPHKFTELSTQVHIDIWSSAKQLAMPMGRYAALLVSMHGTGLYERFTSWQNSASSIQIVQDFLNREYEFQEKLINTLSHDEYYARYATREAIERNQKLVATWDTLSILLCQGFVDKQEVTQVPTVDGTIALQLTLRENKNNLSQITVSPWPFEQSEVNLVYEGRLLSSTFHDEKTMRDALMEDCWVTLKTTLKPGRD
ncbi:hypothetical protein WA1_11350 [Scytonema hofmannii PCC 7110]|uniref:DUF3891 domain-containing protein n=1 Tax=Scytonema hofmannii PCC 7110 TaxID=128403 RepID=A0A139XFG4_9CYAN|nr:DUF3891 family protein [Scytonema hofmannii]KYC43426.1 hypothetical protein WA1_11350 [Scytonema hofmannii PCC 7110]